MKWKQKREKRSFGKLWRLSGHRVMVRLLERYEDEPRAAAALYSICCNVSLEAALAMVGEMRVVLQEK